jgi:hypothetical protein
MRKVIHDRRIDVPAPEDHPDGTDVVSERIERIIA